MDFSEEKFLEEYWNGFVPDTISRDDTIILTAARGCEVFDVKGRRYLDFCSQAGVLNIGHNHPVFIDAWSRYLKSIHADLSIQEPGAPFFLIASDFHFHFEIEVGEEVIEISQGALRNRLKKYAFGDDTVIIKQVTGATINNSVIKLVTKLTGKKNGIAFYGGFYGRAGHSLAATKSKVIQREGFDVPGHMLHIPYFKEERELKYYLREVIPYEALSDYSFVIIEMIQGEGGVNLVSPYTIQLLEYFRKKGLVIICDEVQEGFGRTGKMFSYEHFGFVPDIVTISKSFGSGDPISAGFFHRDNALLEKWEEKWKIGSDSSTFQWNPHAVFSAIITLDILEKENLISRAQEMGENLAKTIDEALKKTESYPGRQIFFRKGIGLHQAIECEKAENGKLIPDADTRNRILTMLRKNGILTLAAGNPNVHPSIRFMPPLVVTKEEIDEFGVALEKSIQEALTS